MVVAHAGHWLVNLAYAGPVLGLVGWLGVVKLKEAARRRRGEAPTAAPADAHPD